MQDVTGKHSNSVLTEWGSFRGSKASDKGMGQVANGVPLSVSEHRNDMHRLLGVKNSCESKWLGMR